MNRAKRLLVVLLATLTMVVGAFGVAYAASAYEDHYVYRISSSGSTSTVPCLRGDTHITINISRDDETYDGLEKAASISVTPSDHYWESSHTSSQYNFKCDWDDDDPGPEDAGYITLGTISYSGTTAAGNSYSSTTAPSDAGDYTASVKITAYNPDLGDRGTVTITKSFKINPKPIDVEWTDNSGTDPEGAYTYNYDGENHVPDAKITSGLESGDKVSVNVTGAARTVATHTATAKLVGPDAANYEVKEETKTKKFTIAPKPLHVTWKGVDGSADDFDYVYNGEEQGPTAELDKSGIVRGESCDIVVSGQQKNVGIYDGGTDAGHGPKASATLTNTNYTIAEGEDTHDFRIDEFIIVSLAWDPASLVYNAGYQHPEATVTDSTTGETLDCGLTYTVKQNDSVVPEGTKMNVGTYVVEAALSDTEKNFKFDPHTEKSFTFTVTPKEVSVTLDIEDPIIYDADYHKPDITADTIFDADKDTCRPAVSLKGKTLSGEDVNIPDCNDSTLTADKTGVIHASSGKYTAKVEALVGEASSNYALKANTQIKFEILPREVTLDWYRPANNVYGEYLDEEGNVTGVVTKAAKVKTTDSTPKLVFNGKEQAPVAEIREGMLLKNAVTEEEDECVVTVSAPKGAIEVGTYTVTDIDFSNPDYTRDQSGQKYQIVKRPVMLEWDKYYTKYNGVEQERDVTITNIQKDEYGDDYTNKKGVVVDVKEVLYSDGKHFGEDGEDGDEPAEYIEEPIDNITYDGWDKEFPFPDVDATDGSAIEEARIIIDAGTRTMTAGALTDTFNYTYDKLTGDKVDPETGKGTGTNESSEEKVDLYETLYIIHQHKIATIDWKNIKRTYNASNQKPIAELSKNDLQGPDTVKEVIVRIHEDLNSEADDFLGKCNVGEYIIYVLRNETFRGIKGGEVDRSMNYRISGKPADPNTPQPDDPQADDETEEPTKNLTTPFVITKKLLTVTVNNKTGYYGDDPATYKYSVKYAGLVNGDVNKDDNHNNKNIPGKYTPDEGEEKDVVEGTIKYTTNYKKWGKPGKYSIKASGLKSDNYAIKYVAGKLTIKDRKLSGDLLAKAKAGNKKGKITWTGVSGAAKYQLYFSECNHNDKKYTPKLYKTFGAKTRSFTVKKLKKNHYYKFYVVALDSEGKQIAKTEQHHFCTNNVSGKYTNPKTIEASKKKVTLKKGKTLKLKGVVTKVKSGKTLTNGDHTKKVRFRSAVPKVATVSADGTIKGVSTGWCRVYVMAANGIWQTVEVTVK